MNRCFAGACAVLLAAAAVAGCTAADSRQQLPLWQVDGEHNRLFLLASVHLLRPADYPLPEALYAAYDESDIIVMELDLDDLDPAHAAAVATELGVSNDPNTLATVLGDDDYQRALAMAATASLPLESLGKTEAWLAAITLEQLMLTRIGFAVSLGLENHFLERAVADEKEIIGLETVREQLQILDELPAPIQRSLFMRTIEASDNIEDTMNRLIRAWRGGDTDSLASIALQDLQQQPLLYEQLVVARNRNWVTQLAALLQGNDDYLVVVGALHLVGADGVPALLEQRGYRVRQLETAVTP